MGGMRVRATDAEMRAMRDAGMTNADIANSLGVTQVTVYRHIGAQPGKNWAGYQRRMRQNPIVREVERLTQPDVQAVPESAPAAELVVTNRVTYLTGEAAEYCVDHRARVVRFMPAGAEGMLEIGFDEWAAFAREVQAVARNLDGMRVPVEMW